jgi:hypothetical protein
MRSLLALFCLLLAICGSAETTYTISGTVVMHNTPVKDVLVTITAVAHRSAKLSCITDGDGRFRFTNLPAGKFSLSAEQRSGASEAFHQSFDGYATAIVTGPGLDSENLLFALTPTGSITGTVTDEEGDPVRSAQVMLFHRGIFSGKMQSVLEKQEQTDASGNFHFGQLAIGAYLIAVQARPWYAQPQMGEGESSGDNAFDVAYPITYSGGSTDPGSASLISVTEGGSTSVDISLRAVPSVHLSIHRPESETRTGLMFSAIGPDGVTIHVSSNSSWDNGKGQVISGIAPGRYIFAEDGGTRKTVELSSHSSLDLTAGGGTSLSGRLNFEGETPGTHPRGAGLGFVSESGERVYAGLSPDGSFIVSGVAPGAYHVVFSNPLYYIKSVEAGGRLCPDGKIEVTSGASLQLTITAAKAVASLDGTAIKDGKPFAGAIVLLLPVDLSKSSLIRRDQSDSDGTFTLPNIAPGRYTLLAIDDGRDLAYADASVIKPYLSFGQSIEIPRAANEPVKINVAARQR